MNKGKLIYFFEAEKEAQELMFRDVKMTFYYHFV